jgi:hypothetical protein
MLFEPQEGSATTVTKVSGILALKDGKFIVVDRVTNVTMQLQGTGLEAEVGNLVEITGTVDAAAPTVAGASQLIDVTSIKRLTRTNAPAAARQAPGRQEAGLRRARRPWRPLHRRHRGDRGRSRRGRHDNRAGGRA